MENCFNPVKILHSNNWKKDLEFHLDKFKVKKPLIIASSGNLKRLNLQSFFDKVFSNINTNPTFNDCLEIVNYSKNINIDGIVAIGGGSTMDLAKVVNSSYCNKIFNIDDIINYKKKFKRKLKSIFIPTTHGSGSEVTKWGTVWNKDKIKKYSIDNTELYPDLAILDPSLTISLPINLSVITTLDALSHSFESLWNKNSNSYSEKYALKSINIIFDNISLLKKDSNNLKIRKKLLEASSLAGLSISQTRTAAAHSISYPLTLIYNIPHGTAASISLCSLLDLNYNSIKKNIDLILIENDLNSVDELKDKIKLIPENIIPFNLRKYGVSKKDLNYILKKSFTKERMTNNIMDLTEKDVSKILDEIY